MSGKKKQSFLWSAIVVTIIILAAVVILAVVKRQPAEQVRTEHSESESVAEEAVDDNRPKVSLEDIVKKARTWRPAYTVWYGETAQDFTLTDIAGKEHKLSDYRGKNTIIIFWATWCAPCVQEVPHLISLRNSISEDKLAMLAISTENHQLVKKFADDRKLNYPVFAANIRTLPDPFNTVTYIPCSIFIDPQGKIKMAASGAISVGEIKAILEAE